MGSQVFLPAADSRSPVDLEAELVRLRRHLQHCQRRTRLAIRSLQEVQALLFGLQGPAPWGNWRTSLARCRPHGRCWQRRRSCWRA